MVVEFLSGSQLDLGSSFATIASNFDTEKEISPVPQLRGKMLVPILLVIIQYSLSICLRWLIKHLLCQAPRRSHLGTPGAKTEVPVFLDKVSSGPLGSTQ